MDWGGRALLDLIVRGGSSWFLEQAGELLGGLNRRVEARMKVSLNTIQFGEFGGCVACHKAWILVLVNVSDT